mmetsp:Transcript_6336/g.11585  ORF Transcript_6336/g.11585 Transcript_6336/m.11585 type:complete len:234 (+) Transcript_6336:692-1393(+)
MQALKYHDLVWLDQLRGILVSRVVVVDGLVNGLAFLQSLDLHTHEGEVVLPGVQGGEARGLAARTVVGVVIVQADNCHHVPDGCVPRLHLRAQSSQNTSKEGRFATARVRRHANDHRSVFQLCRGIHNWVHVIFPSVGRVKFNAIHLPQFVLRLGRWPHQTSRHTLPTSPQRCACNVRPASRTDKVEASKEPQCRCCHWQCQGVGSSSHGEQFKILAMNTQCCLPRAILFRAL